MKNIYLHTILLLLISFNSFALEPKVTGSLHETNISGHVGKSRQVLGEGSDSHAVSLIVATEKSDKPCWIRLYKGHLDGIGAHSSDWFDKCRSVAGMKFVGFDDYGSTKVRGVSVCTNNKSNNRLKGVRFYGARVNDDASLTIQTAYDEFKRTNCKTWHKAVYCPKGMIATKLIVEYTDDTVNGLGLKCKTVSLK